MLWLFITLWEKKTSSKDSLNGKILFFICMGILPAYYVCAPHVCLCPWRPEESPEAGVTTGS